jgi:hypothetical protein
MRAVFLSLALCVTCLAQTTHDVDVIVPESAAHPQDWLHLQLRNKPKPNYRSKSVGTLGEFVAPEVISKIVVDQYAGPPDDVSRYLKAMPTAEGQYFGTSVELCEPTLRSGAIVTGARLDWTSTSTITFESGRRGTLAVATVIVSKAPRLGSRPKVFGLSDTPDCLGLDKVPVDSLYVSYTDPDDYSWAFVITLQKKK